MIPIIHQVNRSGHILIASHRDPDGDALGSLLALGLALSKIGKKATLYNESSIPAVYRFLPSVERIVHHVKKPSCYDTAFILDCGDISRLGTECETINKIACTINLDHHISNTGFGDIQCVDTEACATSEIVYRLISAFGVAIDRRIATCIYTGILTDTGSFRFSNTNQAAFEISREMAEIGVEPYDVAQHVFGTYSLGRIKLLNLALDSIEISGNGKLSIMTVTKHMLDATGTQPEDVDGLINYARRIRDVKVAALIQEPKNGTKPQDRRKYHVSLRSDGSVDVAAIASSFGGGGHYSAAGFQIETTLRDLKSEITILSEKF
jgi:phosphoesterase RecJ-like protein